MSRARVTVQEISAEFEVSESTVRRDLQELEEAKLLRGFEVNVTATGLIAGTVGRHLLKQLDAQTVAHRFVEVAGETRTNLKVYDDHAHVTTELNEIGFEVQTSDLEAFSQGIEALLCTASYLVLGGSLPHDIYGRLIQMANAQGVRTM